MSAAWGLRPCSKVKCHPGSRQIGKSVISGPNQAREIGISEHAEKCPRSRPDLVPFHAIEPAILVGATTHRQDQGGRQRVTVPSICRYLEGCDQFHVGLDLRLLVSGGATERSNDISEDRAPAAGPGRNDLLGPRRAPVPRDRTVETSAQLPPIPISDRIEPSAIS